MSLFNNREIALAFWIVLIATVLVGRAKAWPALKALLVLFRARPVRTYCLLLLLYVTCCVAALSNFGLWGAENLKVTVLWLFGFALLAPFQSEKIEAEGEREFFKRLVLESCGVSAVVAFLASAHTFSLILEVALTGIAILLTVVAVFSAGRKETQRVAHVSHGLLALLGAVALGAALFWIAQHFSEFATVENARELLIPIVLTLLFVPFMYGTHVYLVYERAFLRIGYSIKDPIAKRYAKKRLLWEMGADLDGVKKWLRHISLFRPASEAEVAASIAEIKSIRRRERAPYQVPPLVGWAPNIARNFLVAGGIQAKDYHRSYDGWRASSNYLKLGKSLLANNIAYYLEGTEYAVLKLVLVLNVDGDNNSQESLERFQKIASLLISSALRRNGMTDQELPLEAGGQPVVLYGKRLALSKEEFHGGKGYELQLVIDVETAEERD